MELKCALIHLVFFVFSSYFSLTKELFVEETSHFTLTCHAVSDTQRLIVTYSNKTNETLAIFTHSKCTVSRGETRCFTLDNTLSVIEVEVTSQTRTIVSYTCGDDAVVNITFYASPNNVSCGPPTLDESGRHVNVTCIIGKVYPQPKCIFYDTSNDSNIIGSKTSISYVPWGNPLYYNAECSIEIAVPNQTEVHKDISVYVYPDFNINGTMYGVNYTLSWPLIIEPVSVVIDPSCPLGTHVVQGLIKIGTTATCTCLKTTSSTALARVLWYLDNQQVSSIETDSSSILTVSYPKDLNKSFQCKASPFASDPIGITFKPQFAFGPTDILTDFKETTIDLCSRENEIIRINAWVKKRDVSPDIRVKAAVERTEKSSTNRNEAYDISVRTNDSALTSDITTTVFLTVTSGGQYVIIVTFVNTVFNDLIAVTNISITVREPPLLAPILIINGGEPLKEGITTSNINITCYAPGGYPNVSEVTISCAGQNSTKSGNRLTVRMDFEKIDSGSLCFCQAIHKSGCYNNNMASAIVIITRSLNITSFTANNQTHLEVNQGEPVRLSCSAEGYPRPVILINVKDAKTNGITLLTSDTTEVAANIWQSQYTLFSVICEDSHNYTCRAMHLESNITVGSNVYINVKCSFRLKNHSMVNDEISAVLGQDLVITVDVIGNPPPNGYWLQRGLNKYQVDNESFHVEFTALNAPFGTLKLTLFNIQRKDVTLFSLVVDNGMQENMTYSFLVFERTTESDGKSLYAVIGGALGIVAFILFIIAVYMGFIRHSKGCKKKKERTICKPVPLPTTNQKRPITKGTLLLKNFIIPPLVKSQMYR